MLYQISPFERLSRLNSQLYRFFDDPYPTSNDERWAPSVDIAESTSEFRILADVPGVKPADMEISLHNGLLTMRGERSTENEVKGNNVTHRERTLGSFMRRFSLPGSAEEATVSAKSVNGVLEVVIPKAKKAQPVAIKVQGE